jgi:hypothetical protein
MLYPPLNADARKSSPCRLTGTLGMNNSSTPRRSDVTGLERKPAQRVLHPVLRAFFALFGVTIILWGVVLAYEVLKSGQLGTFALIGILSLLCMGSAFTFLGVTGRDRVRG